MIKSLETNWIRKKTDKTLPIPEIMEYPLSGCGGQYYHPVPNAEIYTLKGKPLSMRYGVIVICSGYDDDVKAGIIAHEWRHHMQHYSGIKYETPKCRSNDVIGEKYNSFARQYFLTSHSEMDALRFQYKHVGFLGLYKPWEELFYDFVKDLHVKPIISYANNKPIIEQNIFARSSSVRYSYSFNEETRRIQRSLSTTIR